MRSTRQFCAAAIAFAIAGCGDNNNSPAVVGGTISGLAGDGLVLQLNGGDDLAVERNGSFRFATPLAYGTEYVIAVAAQPSSPSQTCTVTNGTGTITGEDAVVDIGIACVTNEFAVSGMVQGLSGSGLVLENNDGDALAIASNGPFTFETPLASGTTFEVSVSTQPKGPSQTCTVSGGTGTIGAGPVATVVVDCDVDRFTIGGTVSGLGGTVVLQNNGGDDIMLTANGSFAFPSTVASGAGYEVTVLGQPAVPSQTCTVTSGAGTVTDADVTSVAVECVTNHFTIGGTVVGLAGSGLVLQNNGGDDLSIAADGSFTFSTTVASGEGFAVTVAQQPTGPWQTCEVTGGTGTVGGGNVTSVMVNCTTDRFAIGGTISGLSGTVVLQNNSGDDLTLTANGTFAFSTLVASGASYEVTVASNPTSPIKQTCVVGAGTGTVTNDDVGDVTVTCTTDRFTVGGTVSGLATGAQVVLRNNGGDDLVVDADGSFAFATTVASGDMYTVTVATNPSSPVAQTCTVVDGIGSVGASDVTSVAVTCETNRYTINAAVTGLPSGDSLVLQNNGADDLTFTADGTQPFATAIASGEAYAVTIKTQPAGAVCSVTAGSGSVGAADVTVDVECRTECFSFTNTAGEDITNNTWFDECATTAGNTITVTLRDASGTVVYEQSGSKVGTWMPYDLLTSTDTTTFGTPPNTYNEQFYSPNHDRMITLGNGDRLMIPGRFAANMGCGGSLGDGYGIVIYSSMPDYYNNIKLMVQPYRQMNYQAGSPRSFPGWSTSHEISWNGGSTMSTCTAVTPFLGTFSVRVTP